MRSRRGYSNGGGGGTSGIFRIPPEVEAGLQSWQESRELLGTSPKTHHIRWLLYGWFPQLHVLWLW